MLNMLLFGVLVSSSWDEILSPSSLLGSLAGLRIKLPLDQQEENKFHTYIQEPHKNIGLPGSQGIQAHTPT